MRWKVVHGECVDVLSQVSDGAFDAVVCDPPYGLNFMGKGWDKFSGYVERGASSRAVGDDGGRHDEGYRNMKNKMPEFQAWCTQWAEECLRVLKPGGHLLAFGGTRTFHRLTCGLEDAGFEIRDCLSWLYGSGFPKSLDLSKAIDKAAGVEREVVGYDVSRVRPNRTYDGGAIGNIGGTGRPSDRTDNGATLTAPATPDAERWQGWGTALKPAWEPIVMARKPLIGTVAANVLEHGTGAINVDACRIAGESPSARMRESARKTGKTPGRPGEYKHTIEDRTSPERYMEDRPGEQLGRWPANIALDEAAGVQLDEQSGISKSTGGSGAASQRTALAGDVYGEYSGATLGQNAGGLGDKGGAHRFFYCAKTSRKERTVNGKVDNKHPTVKPRELMRWLVRMVTPPNGVVLDPFTGSGSTGAACMCEGFRFLGIERELESVVIARQRIELYERAVNNLRGQ